MRLHFAENEARMLSRAMCSPRRCALPNRSLPRLAGHLGTTELQGPGRDARRSSISQPQCRFSNWNPLSQATEESEEEKEATSR